MFDALAHAGAGEAVAEADAAVVLGWLRRYWPRRVDLEERKLDAAGARRHRMLVARDSGGGVVCLVRKEVLARAVPNQARLEAALRLLRERGVLLPGDGDGNLTRQKRLADGTKMRFLYFSETSARPEKDGMGPQARGRGKTPTGGAPSVPVRGKFAVRVPGE